MTLNEIHATGDDELRKAVANLILPSWRVENYDVRSLPDYPHDLNAVHEVEKRLSDLSFSDYTDMLMQVVNGKDGYVHWSDFGGDRRNVSATARQRCQALILTLGVSRSDVTDTATPSSQTE